MEGAGANYLFALATLAMTLAGFCAIVIVLRQSIGQGLSGFHVLRIADQPLSRGGTWHDRVLYAAASAGIVRRSSACSLANVERNNYSGHPPLRLDLSKAPSRQDFGQTPFASLASNRDRIGDRDRGAVGECVGSAALHRSPSVPLSGALRSG
jgi:hypothetical protein